VTSQKQPRLPRVVAAVRRRRDPHQLPDRVWQLERDVAECRNLSLRVAELTDLVGELLVELARADPERSAAVLERYREELGG
jgi:hypothetical protein